jgi:hypothetical protein
MSIEDRQSERDREENPGQPGGELHQHIRGLSAKQILGHGPAKGCAQAFTLGPLHQNDEHHQQRHQDPET